MYLFLGLLLTVCFTRQFRNMSIIYNEVLVPACKNPSLHRIISQIVNCCIIIFLQCFKGWGCPLYRYVAKDKVFFDCNDPV